MFGWSCDEWEDGEVLEKVWILLQWLSTLRQCVQNYLRGSWGSFRINMMNIYNIILKTKNRLEFIQHAEPIDPGVYPEIFRGRGFEFLLYGREILGGCCFGIFTKNSFRI